MLSVWLDIEGTEYWSNDHKANSEYIASLHSRLTYYGYKVGVYSSAVQWAPITGNSKILSHLPVWYAHYETTPQPNFNDWQPFGGWSHPSVKQFRGTHRPKSYCPFYAS